MNGARRARLLSVATEEFGRKGFAAASLNSILAAAALGKSSYYYYFESKEDLFATCLLHSTEQLFREVAPLPLASLTARNFWVELDRWAVRISARGIGQPLTLALFRTLPTARRALMPRLQSLSKQIWAPIEEFIRRGQALGCVRDDLDSRHLCAIGFAADAALDEALLLRTRRLTTAQVQAHARLVVDTWKRLLLPPRGARATRARR